MAPVEYSRQFGLKLQFLLDEQLISVCVYVYEIQCTSLYMCALTLGIFMCIMLPIFPLESVAGVKLELEACKNCRLWFCAKTVEGNSGQGKGPALQPHVTALSQDHCLVSCFSYYLICLLLRLDITGEYLSSLPNCLSLKTSLSKILPRNFTHVLLRLLFHILENNPLKFHE